MWIASNWDDYELLDCGDGRRLERWDKYILDRPDPQAIWHKQQQWAQPDAIYNRSSQGGGSWDVRKLPQSWRMKYGKLQFNVKPMSFKHTGIFPEQAANWDYIISKITGAKRPINVLNLFAYTGGATIAAASAGASVCHVDAAKGMVAWAKENAVLSGLSEAPIRYIVDDCGKFIKRELKRGRRYDAIIMDPPSYGRGPTGEIWRFEDNIAEFCRLCTEVLSDNPLFIIVNSYTTGFSPSVPGYILQNLLSRRFGGRVQSGELGLPVTSTGLVLPCGHTSRWECE